MTSKIALKVGLALALMTSPIITFAAAEAVGDAAAGKAKAAACTACHNADGNSTNPESNDPEWVAGRPF